MGDTLGTRAAVRASIAVAAVVVGLGVGEVALRAVGPGVWRPFVSMAHTPVVTRADPILGWVNRPGRYTWSAGGSAVAVVVDGDGARANPSRGDRQVWVLGGSFAFGLGVDQGEDFPALLAGNLPDTRVRNLAVPGYGTVQSMLLYQRLRDELGAPAAVLYGLTDLHDARNAATTSWLYALDRAAAGDHASHPWVRTPWASWDGHALSLHPPAGYRHGSLAEHSAVANALEGSWVAVHDRFTSGKTEVTVQVLVALRDAVVSDGGRLTVAMLHAPQSGDRYRTRLLEEGVDLLDLTGTGYPGPGLEVPGDGHPSAAVHRAWADRLLGPLAAR